MSQSTISVSDGTGNEVLNALNRLFTAISTLQSGDTEPPLPNPLMLWADTANNLLKIRSIENNDWIALGQISHSGLFVGEQAITSDKIAPQAVRLTHIQRGPLNTVLVAKGDNSDPKWESIQSAYTNRARVLTAQGSQSDPVWATLPETFDGWCVGDLIYISLSGDYDSERYGSASINASITSTTKTSFSFEGTGNFYMTDPDLFFNDHFSRSGNCWGTVSSNYFCSARNSFSRVDADVTEYAYWDLDGWCSVRRR
jgi:hypothetical protein